MYNYKTIHLKTCNLLNNTPNKTMYRAAFERVSKVEYEVTSQDNSLSSKKDHHRSLAITSSSQLTIDIRTAKLQFIRPFDDDFEPRDHRNPPHPIS